MFYEEKKSHKNLPKSSPIIISGLELRMLEMEVKISVDPFPKAKSVTPYRI